MDRLLIDPRSRQRARGGESGDGESSAASAAIPAGGLQREALGAFRFTVCWMKWPSAGRSGGTSTERGA